MKSLMLIAAFVLVLPLAPTCAAASVDRGVTSSPGFLRYHPDLRYQRSGLEAWEDGRSRAAFEDFQRAARFGNKVAQAMVAEMYWTGQGTPRDRALGYAWMDLAAERGYAALLVLRERYWSELDAVERERAIDEGQAIFAEYGDDVAKPRLEARLERGRRKATGSRVGANTGAVEVYSDVQFSPLDARAPFRRLAATRNVSYYDPKYWQPLAYWRWQDRLLNQLPRGAVSVLPVQSDDAR